MWAGWIVAVTAGLIAGWWPHGVGATPLLAVPLWGTGLPRRRDALLACLGAVLVRDLLAGLGGFTLVRMLAVAGTMACLWALRIRPTPPSMALGVMAAAPAYHLMLTVGDWATQMCSTNPRTLSGLLATLRGTWPYMERAWLADVLLTAVFAGAYAIAQIAILAARPPACERWPR